MQRDLHFPVPGPRLGNTYRLPSLQFLESLFGKSASKIVVRGFVVSKSVLFCLAQGESKSSVHACE
jgi:hypothetical protein